MLEQIVQRRLTTAFIGTQPVGITLVPRARTQTATGGYALTDGEPRSPQTMRLIEPPSHPAPVRTLDGIERVVEFMLLGEHDAVIGERDWFVHDGAKWEVVYLHHFNGWERRAEVARRG